MLLYVIYKEGDGMNTLKLFEKEIEYKDYDCSYNPNIFNKRPPIFNFYLQLTEVCNSKCSFCDKSNCTPIEQDLNKEKLYSILKELFDRNLLGRISITGGEPLLFAKKLGDVLKIISLVNKNAYVSVNTNASCLEEFEKIENKDVIKEIIISRHHYLELNNKNIFKIDVATLDKIKEFIVTNPQLKVKFNCVLLKNNIDSAAQMEKYLDVVSQYNINEVRFISLMPLTETFDNLYVNVESFIEELSRNTNAGYLYDKDICNCFPFVYISSVGVPVSAFIRNTKKTTCEYLRQFVYTSQNYLLDGFGGKKII